MGQPGPYQTRPGPEWGSEPGVLTLLGAGLIGLTAIRRRRS
ncbi:MAG: PEP-CTERM sorting domain-containing protein [Betaproteobacteria bacterium]|nr:PEP-CTERM sorting domain-containing protein [Betaproteobacteria bacterium]